MDKRLTGHNFSGGRKFVPGVGMAPPPILILPAFLVPPMYNPFLRKFEPRADFELLFEKKFSSFPISCVIPGTYVFYFSSVFALELFTLLSNPPKVEKSGWKK